MLTVPYTQKARVNASSGIRSGSKLWRMEHFRDVTKMIWFDAFDIPKLPLLSTSPKSAGLLCHNQAPAGWAWLLSFGEVSSHALCQLWDLAGVSDWVIAISSL